MALTATLSALRRAKARAKPYAEDTRICAVSMEEVVAASNADCAEQGSGTDEFIQPWSTRRTSAMGGKQTLADEAELLV